MRHTLNRSLLALLIGVCLFGSLPSWAEEATAAPLQKVGPAAGPATDSSAAELSQMTLEQIMTPAPEWQVGGPGYCNSLNSYWCTYSWNYSTGCCRATFHLPGAYCGDRCP